MLALKHSKFDLEAGCDEAGRGCLAGPVVAAAVILPLGFKNEILNDSKKLTEAKRDKLRPIIEKEAVAWGIGVVSPKEIDEINILNASFLAMHRAIDQLSSKPEYLLIDGNRFNPYPEIDHECMIKGDGRFLNIAAASILAKTERDQIMEKLHKDYPDYHWNKNKGYPTAEHRSAIEKTGASPHHRMSFQLLPSQMKLDF
ncbi:MAG: ribonuclease HII [Schleiferiaceae bacterium]|jgi:ribonuclease HII|nr:ribonuclease HII [Schleiferiaceae bacterium]